MKVTDLTLAQWQNRIDEFRSENPSAPAGAAFRIDGTQFSTARFFGAFIYNGDKYTVFECRDTPGNFTCEYATIAVRMDILKWLNKKLKEEGEEK